jgi:hypothetical protein
MLATPYCRRHHNVNGSQEDLDRTQAATRPRPRGDARRLVRSALAQRELQPGGSRGAARRERARDHAGRFRRREHHRDRGAERESRCAGCPTRGLSAQRVFCRLRSLCWRRSLSAMATGCGRCRWRRPCSWRAGGSLIARLGIELDAAGAEDLVDECARDVAAIDN